jgi:hypothetical protein
MKTTATPIQDFPGHCEPLKTAGYQGETEKHFVYQGFENNRIWFKF